MGYVPGYENDVFISYAHVDNEPLVPGKPGWVDFFEDLLRKRVRARMRGEIQFFRDQQLRLYGQFSEPAKPAKQERTPDQRRER